MRPSEEPCVKCGHPCRALSTGRHGHSTNLLSDWATVSLTYLSGLYQLEIKDKKPQGRLFNQLKEEKIFKH